MTAADAARALREVIAEVEPGDSVLITREDDGGQVILLNPHEYADLMGALDEAGARGDTAAIRTARWIDRHPFGPERPEDLLDLPEAR